MSLPVLSLLIFLVTLALVVSSLYLLIELPSARKRMRKRFERASMAMAYAAGETVADRALLRAEIFSRVPALDRLMRRLPAMRRLNLFIQQSAAAITAGMLITLSLLIGWFVFLASLLLTPSIVLALVFGLIGGAAPFAVVAIRRQRRFRRFEELFPDAMDLLARAVRAGHAFTSGLDLIAKEMPAPLSDEFQIAYEQQNLGLPLREALQNLAERVPIGDVRLFVTALTIQRETGGNLAEILDNLSHVIRERFKLERQIKVYTAQGRLTLYLLLGLPPLMGTVIYIMNPHYISRLFTDPLGMRFLVAGIVLHVIGYFVIRRIIQPKF